MALRVRALSDEERLELQRRTQARTEPVRAVERARIVWRVAQGERVVAVAQRLGVVAATVRLWVKRFNAAGIAGLDDHPRTGRPERYTPTEVGDVVATALTDPQTLDLPFACWTLDRLTAYLHERSAEAGGPLPISRSQIDRILSGEGLRWRKQETWFGERVDPEFAQKRGRSPHSTRSHPRTVSSSASTRWDQKAPSALPVAGH